MTAMEQILAAQAQSDCSSVIAALQEAVAQLESKATTCYNNLGQCPAAERIHASAQTAIAAIQENVSIVQEVESTIEDACVTMIRAGG